MLDNADAVAKEITLKELWPLVLACAIQKEVHVITENSRVVYSGTPCGIFPHELEPYGERAVIRIIAAVEPRKVYKGKDKNGKPKLEEEHYGILSILIKRDSFEEILLGEFFRRLQK